MVTAPKRTDGDGRTQPANAFGLTAPVCNSQTIFFMRNRPPSLPAFLPKLYRYIVRDRSFFVVQMRSLRGKNYKVSRLIIKPVSVDMVDNLPRTKRTPKRCLHNGAMDVFSTAPKIDGGIVSLVREPAFLGAIFAAALSSITGANAKQCPAIHARGINTGFTPLLSAGIGAVFSITRLSTMGAFIHTGRLRTQDRTCKRFSPACIRQDEELFQL